ncbi:hypothetical protein CEE37_00060 [candidate division LCP-89 bacterium B3_LCP]|uniref:Gingipain R n=1 Tax=candidate division LCP-89 bacterium B3_LCP TaxID=2012998 RepID=A0A532V548_UNCL8|nr:MAG: hypothetical protein CEE37_00060 [candidate division LCP-89 bacterium B3_LCP]
MMGRLNLIISVMATITLAASIAASGVTTHTYTFEQPTVEIIDGQAMVVMESVPNWGLVGSPLLPHAQIALLLTPGEEAVSITIETAEPVALGDGYRIAYRHQPYPLSTRSSHQPTSPDAAIYSSDDHFPASAVFEVHTGFLCGHSIANTLVCPVIYRPLSGELSYYPWIEVTVKSQPTQKSITAHAQMLKVNPSVRERVAGLIQNPEMLATYGPETQLDTDFWNLLVITGSALVNDYQEFIDYKNRSGIRTTVETVEDIYINFPGDDFQEKIRNCIIEYYSNNGISYVFLCGDVDYIDCRELWVQAGTYTEDIPSDLYYAGLDGNWNNDGDSHWGEPGEEDLYADVFIGRSCADAGEVTNVVNKSLMYQTDPVVDEVVTTLMLGEDLGWDSWGWEYMQEIHLGSTNWGYSTVGIAENIAVDSLYEYPGTSWSGMSNLLPLLNSGPNVVHHLGHASWNYNFKFYNSQITDNNFTNNGVNHNFFIGYSQGCHAGAFEHNSSDCIMEKFTKIAHAAVAFIGNSRFGWGAFYTTDGPSQRFHRQFGDAIYGENITVIGKANHDSKTDNVSATFFDNYLRWCFYELNLLGDPTLDIWTAVPGVFTPTYDPEIVQGSILFEVSDIGMAGALVTLSQDNVVLGQGSSNASGIATVFFSEPLQQSGQLDLMITAHDMLPYAGTVDITEPIPPVSVVLTPVSSLIQIPATGGSFDYNIEAINNEPAGIFFNLWCDITMPNGSIYGPVIGPIALYLAEGGTVDRDRMQNVPGGAPAGVYSFNAYAVAGTDTSLDSFTFEKLTAGDGSSLIDNWVNDGEPFDEWLYLSEEDNPTDYALIGNYPNPFNPSTVISFQLPVANWVKLDVFDINGRRVGVNLVSTRQYNAGTHQITFDGSNLASGIYIYHLTAGEFTTTGKMVLMK